MPSDFLGFFCVMLVCRNMPDSQGRHGLNIKGGIDEHEEVTVSEIAAGGSVSIQPKKATKTNTVHSGKHFQNFRQAPHTHLRSKLHRTKTELIRKLLPYPNL